MANPKATEHVCAKAKEAFAAMDKNADGEVKILEFRDYCKQVPGMEGVFEAFNTIDTGNDHKITIDELDDFMKKIPKESIEGCHLKDLFRELDTTGDGKLDNEEFKQLLCSCQYSEEAINEKMSLIGGEDGKITLQEFLDSYHGK